uniref:VWFA domain-containing protein n=1 Tax=Monopterus albus TaxID=43700 RepID=A0A3Q3IYS6_MONAL
MSDVQYVMSVYVIFGHTMLTLFFPCSECENATVADIVFLVKGSSSISGENFQEIRSFLRSIIRALNIGPNKVRIGLAQYSNKPHQEFLLKDHTNSKSLLAAVEKIPHREEGRETDKAIDFLLKEYFTKEAGSRASQRVPQIVVVISDGESKDNVSLPARQLRQQGVIVYAIGVGEVNQKQLKSIANRPSERFVLTTASYQGLQTLTQGQVLANSDSLSFQELTDSVHQHFLQLFFNENFYCDKSKTLYSSFTFFIFLSLLFYINLQVKMKCSFCTSPNINRCTIADRFADIFFLVDSGLTPEAFSKFKQQLVTLTSQLNVGASTYRVGLAQYGQDTKVEFHLNTFQTKREILSTVRSFLLSPQPDQPRKLGSALQYASDNFFTKEAGGRAEQGSPQFLVVVSGKDSDDRVSREELKLKSAGITVVRMFEDESVEEISKFREAVEGILDFSFTGLDSNALQCLNVQLSLSFFDYVKRTNSCSCFFFPACVQKDEADIFFLMDDSGSITNPDFYDMKKFIIEFVSNFRIGPQYVRTGLVKYSDTPTLVFDVTAYSDKSTVQKAVENIMHAGGGTMTGAALSSMEQHLKRAKSTRGYVVPEYLIVITDGESTDPVKAPAKKLRDLGVIIYAIGVKDSNQTQLLEIAGDLKRTYFVRNFDALRSINSTIITDICSPDGKENWNTGGDNRCGDLCHWSGASRTQPAGRDHWLIRTGFL